MHFLVVLMIFEKTWLHCYARFINCILKRILPFVFKNVCLFEFLGNSLSCLFEKESLKRERGNSPDFENTHTI